MTCVKSVFLSRFVVSPRRYQSVAEKRKCSAELCVTSGLLHFSYVYEIKSMERAPMNSKTQSLIHRKTHITEMLSFSFRGGGFHPKHSSSPSAPLSLALIER